MKTYWNIIKFTFRIPKLFIWWLKNEFLNIIEFQKQLNYINTINKERHDITKSCIYCGTAWEEEIKGRVYNKYGICPICEKKTYHEEDIIERLTSTDLTKGTNNE